MSDLLDQSRAQRLVDSQIEQAKVDKALRDGLAYTYSEQQKYGKGNSGNEKSPGEILGFVVGAVPAVALLVKGVYDFTLIFAATIVWIVFLYFVFYMLPRMLRR